MLGLIYQQCNDQSICCLIMAEVFSVNLDSLRFVLKEEQHYFALKAFLSVLATWLFKKQPLNRLPLFIILFNQINPKCCLMKLNSLKTLLSVCSQTLH